jgi:hypothetical protein
MEKHFMIDIETTGIDPAKEDLLQVAVLELDYVDGYWRPGRNIEFEQRTERQPVTAFARKHMGALYAKCNHAEGRTPEDMRQTLLAFFRECGASPPEVYLMGWNASNFDTPFLMAKGVLVQSTYEQQADGTEKRVGDFHYRIYELGGALSVAAQALGEDRSDFSKVCKAAYPMDLPTGKEHDALHDCYTQTQILNGMLKLLRHTKSMAS